MKKFQLIIYLLSTCFSIYAQEHKSIHQIEKELYKNFSLQKSNQNTKTADTDSIVPINKEITKNLSKAVFGYLPYWEYSQSMQNNLHFDLLTHIAAFDFAASSSGAIAEPSGWPWISLINEAHDTGTKVIMVVTNFTGSEIHTIMTSAFSRFIFLNAVKNKINEYKLDGVNIDFEGINTDDRGSLLNEFMQELTDTVHNISEDLEVSFAAPAVNWGGWNLTNLAKSCDYLFVMGYDFFGSWSTTTGPSAPLIGGNYNVTNTINIEYATVKSFYPYKLILGVPYYGPQWETGNSNEGSSIISYVAAKRFRDAQPLADIYGLKWSNTYKNSWISYKSGSVYNQIWFDNDSSLSLKYDLAISKKLKGVGMWALGYDGSRNELWDLLAKKFVIPVGVKEEEKIQNVISLEQNYPNPFNPTTTIKYSLPAGRQEFQTVQVKVYDILGREVATLVNQKQKPGNYEIEWNGNDKPSGVYYYRLTTFDNSITKKMMLVK